MIRHVVLFQWKTGTSEAKVAECFRELAALNGDNPRPAAIRGRALLQPGGAQQAVDPRIHHVVRHGGAPGCLPAAPRARTSEEHHRAKSGGRDCL